MIWTLPIGILIFILVLMYILSPHFEKYKISSAKFFEPTPKEIQPPPRPRLDTLVLSPPFWFQLAVLLLSLFAFLLAEMGVPRPSEETIGVLLMIDTSASMSADNGSGDRLAAMRVTVNELTQQLEQLAEDYPQTDICIKVQTFDLAVSTIADNVAIADLPTVVANIEHRPLGTKISLVRDVLMSETPDVNSVCPVTHLVVITDGPVPDWIADNSDKVTVFWRDVGAPVDNVGLVSIERSGASAFGSNGIIIAEVSSYGTPPSQTTLTLTAPDGSTQQQTQSWSAPITQRVLFKTSTGGRYNISIEPGGGYIYDDTANFLVDDRQEIIVDWQLETPPPFPFELFGWVQGNENPDLRVIPVGGTVNPGIPTIILGDFYGRSARQQLIRLFDDDSPLLDNLNLDVAETLNIQGIVLPAQQFNIVLGDSEGGVWAATRENPRIAYIPGLPVSDGDKQLQAFSQTLFFNTLRWTLDIELPQMYHLTNTNNLEIRDEVNALHPGEGSTAAPNSSAGDFSDLVPRSATLPDNPLWAWLALAAAFVLVVERYLSMYGGARWI